MLLSQLIKKQQLLLELHGDAEVCSVDWDSPRLDKYDVRVSYTTDPAKVDGSEVGDAGKIYIIK